MGDGESGIMIAFKIKKRCRLKGSAAVETKKD
jgi:hypothetical protein